MNSKHSEREAVTLYVYGSWQMITVVDGGLQSQEIAARGSNVRYSALTHQSAIADAIARRSIAYLIITSFPK